MPLTLGLCFNSARAVIYKVTVIVYNYSLRPEQTAKSLVGLLRNRTVNDTEHVDMCKECKL